MNLKNKRGEVTLATLAIVLVIGLLAVPAYNAAKNVISIFHPDAKAKAQVNKLSDDAQKVKEAQDKLDGIRAREEGARKEAELAKQQRLDQAHQYVVGTGQALAKETNPSLPVKVAIELNKKADDALDPISKARIEEMQVIVDKLVAQNVADREAANKDLERMATDLADERNREKEALHEKSVLELQKKLVEVKVDSLQDKVDKDQTKLSEWASDNKTLIQKIESLTLWLGVLIGVMVLLHWVLPLLAMAFPPLAPFVKFMSALIAYPLHALHSAEKAIVSKTLTETQTSLTAEEAAHEATSDHLVRIATSVATGEALKAPNTPTIKE